MKQRLCRKCSKPLPASRYFKCLACQPTLPHMDDDYVYMGTAVQDNYDFYGYSALNMIETGEHVEGEEDVEEYQYQEDES